MSFFAYPLSGTQPNYILREDLAVKPNQRIVLVHPTEGYLPLIVRDREPYYQIFNRILSAAGISTLAAVGGTNATIQSEQFFDSNNRDVIQVNNPRHLYHVFMGVSPASLKVYLEFPKGTIQRIPDNQNFSNISQYDFVNGWQSPFDDPSPAGEMMIPPGRNLTGFTFSNPLTVAINQPLVKFVGYKYLVQVIRDATLVQAILGERSGFGARWVPLGGMSGFVYDVRSIFDADWIPFRWTPDVVLKAITGIGAQFSGSLIS